MNQALTASNGPAIQVVFGDLSARFPYDAASGQVGLMLVPTAALGRCLPGRERLDEREILALPTPWNLAAASPPDCLVQLSLVGEERPAGYAQGRTLRGGGSQAGLRFERQEVSLDGPRTVVRTHLSHNNGLYAVHTLAGDAYGVLTSRVRVENRGSAPVTLEMLSSFALAGITPFHHSHAPERLRIHRWRTSWAAEARLVSDDVEHLHLERSWQPHSVNVERFGQVGTLPCRGFMPQCAVEDTVAGVTWAAQLAWGGSWQMELYRRGDRLALSGGLADREFGHWAHTLQPGDSLTTPEAYLTAVSGGVDEACERLVRHLDRQAPIPPAERDLPVICNEFCATWGNPTLAETRSLAERLRGSGVRYLVIDAGWYCDPGRSWFDAHGDWQASAVRFPGGLKATCDIIRANGLIPGLWFELETVGADAQAYHDADLLQRDGVPLTVAKRRFRDLRDPAVRQRILDRVVGILRDGGFGYIKVDYNETLGTGPDGDASHGEELRRQVEGSHALFDALQAAMPDLVIEVCASGGHRLEPSWLKRCAMASSSDAHETPETPIVAAALARCIPARQNQIWAVLRPEDSPAQQVWALAAGFLGRLCLSGRFHAIDAEGWARVQQAIDLHRACVGTIVDGSARCFGDLGRGWRSPHGWQALRRTTATHAVIVLHGFAGCAGRTASVPLPEGRWSLTGELAAGVGVKLIDGSLHMTMASDNCAAVAVLDGEASLAGDAASLARAGKRDPH